MLPVLPLSRHCHQHASNGQVDDGLDAPTGICAPRRGVEFATEGSRPFSDLLPGAAELAEPVISSSGWVAEFSRRCATASDG